MTEEQKKEIELEVNRILNSRQDNFQSFVERSTKQFIWVISTLSIVILGLGYFFFGNTAQTINDNIEKGVNKVSFAYQLEDKLQKKIDSMVNKRTGTLDDTINTRFQSTLIEFDEGLIDTVNSIITNKIPNIEASVENIINKSIANNSGKFIRRDTSQNSPDENNENVVQLDILPKGTIIAWYGDRDDDWNGVPSGWAICNGSGNTPDLTNRFILGGDISEMGNKGGSESHKHSYSLKLSPLKHNFNYATSKQHAILTSETIGSNKMENNFTTSELNHLPPYFKIIYLIKL